MIKVSTHEVRRAPKLDRWGKLLGDVLGSREISLKPGDKKHLMWCFLLLQRVRAKQPGVQQTLEKNASAVAWAVNYSQMLWSGFPPARYPQKPVIGMDRAQAGPKGPNIRPGPRPPIVG